MPHPTRFTLPRTGISTGVSHGKAVHLTVEMCEQDIFDFVRFRFHVTKHTHTTKTPNVFEAQLFFQMVHFHCIYALYQKNRRKRCMAPTRLSHLKHILSHPSFTSRHAPDSDAMTAHRIDLLFSTRITCCFNDPRKSQMASEVLSDVERSWSVFKLKRSTVLNISIKIPLPFEDPRLPLSPCFPP